jgi:3-methyladenine DNA glycosylase Mpg
LTAKEEVEFMRTYENNLRYREDRRDFFKQSADVLAPKLLGKKICRGLPNGKKEAEFSITVTEAYRHDDSACYGYDEEGDGNRTKTIATAPLFEKGGICCVYAGMLLIVCGKEGAPDNVLIREAGNHEKYCAGPCKFVEALNLGKDFRSEDMLKPGVKIWIEDDGCDRDYCATERKGLGMNVKNSDRNKKWRFISL